MPLCLRELSLPEECVVGVNLVDALPKSLHETVANFEDHMLQDSDVWTFLSRDMESLRPYDDPSLKSRRVYFSFIKELYHRGLLGFSSHCRGRVGAFAVSKKPKMIDNVLHPRQRLVLDCRLVNGLFRPSPHTSLGSLASMSELYIPDGHKMYISGCDIKDCFYAVRVDEALSDFFGLMQDVSSHDVFSITGGVCGDWGSTDMLTPSIAVLPMGFSWSFYLVQCIHEESVCRALNIPRSGLVLDGYPPPSLVLDEYLAMPYCDNSHVIALNLDKCNAGSTAAQGDLRALGFSVHEEETAHTLFKTLGGIIDGEVGEVRSTSERLWLLIRSFEYIADHPVHPHEVQRLLGHAMVVCTINRYGMCIFRHLYDFVQREGGYQWLNLRARNECLNFVGLIPMLYASMRRPWSTTLNCTDASPDGYGICQREVNYDTVASIGRWQERWRYKHLPPEQWAPRRRALGLNVLESWDTVIGTNPEDHECDDIIDNSDFPEVPLHILNPRLWRTKKMGKWGNSREHITLKEGRALVLAVRRLTRASKNRGKKHLFFVDNLALALAINKGRAHNFSLLRIAQQVSALAIAGGFTVRVRWVPSELNVSDGPSRGQVQPGSYKGSCQGKDTTPSYESDPQVESEDGGQEKSSAAGQKIIEDGAKEVRQQEDLEESLGLQGGQVGFSEEAANYPAFTSEGREACWIKGSEPTADAVGGEECVQRSAAPVWTIFEEVREFLPSRRGKLASVPVRRVPGGLSGPGIHPGQSLKRRRKSGGGGRVQVRIFSGQVDSQSTSSEGMEEGEASIFEAAPPSNHLLWNGHETPGHGASTACAEDDPRPRHVPTSWRIHRCKGTRCGHSSPRSWKALPVVFSDSAKLAGSQAGQDWSLRQHSSSEQQRQGVHWQSAAHEAQGARDERGEDFSVRLCQAMFVQSGEALGLVNLHPYQTRHGGAAEDLNGGERDHAAVKQRGRWMTDQSVRRYTKTGKIQQMISMLSGNHLEYCRWSLQNMEKVMLGLVSPKMP